MAYEDHAGAPADEAAVVDARVAEVQELFDLERDEDVVAAAARFAEDCGTGTVPGMTERAVRVALLEGIALGRLERVEEAVAIFDRLRADFGGSSDAETRDRVVRGMMNRARFLRKLDRTDEVAATYDAVVREYRDDPYPRIARRVAWALWSKTRMLLDAEHEAERETLFEQLADRRDEGADPALDDHIAWCLLHRGWKLERAGDYDGRIKTSDEIVERFGTSTAPNVRGRVVGALMSKAMALELKGDAETGLSIYDEVIDRFGADSENQVAQRVVEALERKGNMLGRGRRHNESIAAFDQALARLSEMAGQQWMPLAIGVLHNKALELGAVGREEEAVVVLDSALAAYLGADIDARTPDSLVCFTTSLMEKVNYLCRLGRSDEADGTLEQLVRVLGDVAQPIEAASEVPLPSEDELAKVFSDTFGTGECWRYFDPPPADPPHEEMAARAVGLYSLTERWPEADEGSLAADGAVGFLSAIADGYALLAGTWLPDEPARLPLPKRDKTERARLMRRFGIDEWLTEHGLQPLLTNVAEPDDDDPTYGVEGEDERDSDSLWPLLLSLLHNHGLRLVLCDSAKGREVLQDVNLRNLARSALYSATQELRWLGADHDLSPVAMGCLLLARGSFMTSHAEPRSSQDVYPNRQSLRRVLRNDRGFRERVDEAGGVLPTWLTEPGDVDD